MEHALTHSNDSPPPISVGMAEAARLIGVTRVHIYRVLIPSGQLKTYKEGRRRLVRYAELCRYVAEREREAA